MDLVDKENVKDALNLLIDILVAKKVRDKDHDDAKFFGALDRRISDYGYIANTVQIQQLIDAMK